MSLTPSIKTAERVVVIADLVLDSPLHIGDGASDARGAATIVRTHDGLPYVPGSAFAGVFLLVFAIARFSPFPFIVSSTASSPLPSCVTNRLRGSRPKEAQTRILAPLPTILYVGF